MANIKNSGTIRPNGLYEAKVTIEYPNGVKKRKSFYSDISILEAKKKGREQQRVIDKSIALGVGCINSGIDFKVWAKKWLETYKKDKVQLSTYNSMEKQLEKYIYPYFSNVAIKDIKPIDIQCFFDQHMSLSSAVKVKLRNLLNGIFEAAIDNDLCLKNPVRGLKLPTYTKVIEKEIYSEYEQKLIIDYIKTHDCSKDIAILLKTGLRRGELLALTWNDIDLDNKVINVNKALKDTAGIPTVGEPETKAGIRKIIFDDELKKILLSINRKVKYRKGDRIVEFNSDYVVHSKYGNMYLPTNWSIRVYGSVISNILEYYSKDGVTLKRLSPHELRHSYGKHYITKG